MSVLAAEWVKVRSLRSSVVTLAIGLGAVLLGVAIAWSAIGMYDSAPPAKRASARIEDLAEVVSMVPQLCLGVLGVLSFSGEYGTGLIRSSLTAVPRRWPVLAAKATVVGGLALVVGLVVEFVTFFVTTAMLTGRYPVATFAERWPMLVVTSLSVVVFGLLGVGLGTILRSVAGSVSVLIGLVYVLPIVFANLPEPWNLRLNSLMIGALIREITGVSVANSVFGGMLAPVPAALVLAAYAVVPLLAGAWLLRRRDA
ncbi:ABC transporter permease subunit [Nonomuraea sp. NN258]|uniref:ABC transporter permease subunit n=1 Tax=Nonomuraea antri TaxID=2730852 RepID=UPI001568C58B|nr:ABC transporter permease subunit [Nonomuraea antri]NRQ38996.1 ABC transporter permease subunit [Nonomuraea antri]